MPNIVVDTTSSTFGLLPSDTAQFGNWLDEYSTPDISVYQDESNVISGLLSIATALNDYLYYYGYSSLNFVAANEMEMRSGPYTIDYYGSFSSSSSDVTSAYLFDAANGTSSAEFGNFYYAGYPVLSSLEVGSTLTGATDLVASPSSPASDIVDGVSLNTSWNGSYWSGTESGYYEAISDTTDSQQAQINILENPTAISFVSGTPLSTEFFTLSPPTVDGVGVDVSDYSTGTTTDTLLVSGISYSSTSMVASQALSTAMSGNDVVSISGPGSLNVISGLVADASSISAVTLYDSAANVATNLDLLEILASENKLASITLTDPGVPILDISATQLASDSLALRTILSPFNASYIVSGSNQTTEISQYSNLIFLYGTDDVVQTGGSSTLVAGPDGVVTMNALGGSQVIYSNVAGADVINAGTSTEFVGAPDAPGSWFTSSAGGADTVFAGSTITYNGSAAASTLFLGGTGFANVVAGASATLFGGSGGGSYTAGSTGMFFWNSGGEATDSILGGSASGPLTVLGSNGENLVVSQLGVGGSGTYIAFGQDDTINAMDARGDNTFFIVDQAVSGGADFSGDTTLIGSSAGQDLFALFEFGATAAHTITIENWQINDTLYLGGFSDGDSAAASGDCREFRVWAGMMGWKENSHGPTEGAADPGRGIGRIAGRRGPEDGL